MLNESWGQQTDPTPVKTSQCFCSQPAPYGNGGWDLFKPTTIAFMKLDERATAPTRNLETDAGMDLYALEDIVVPSLFTKVVSYILDYLSGFKVNADASATKVKTGIALEIPYGMYGKIEDRSSMGSKLLKTLGGVIDSEYRGDVTICLANLSFLDYHIKAGDKIAQIVFTEHKPLIPYEVKILSQSNRGEKGFGSSGA